MATLVEEEVAKLVAKRVAGTLTPSEQACILNTLISSWPMEADSGGPSAVPRKLLDNALTFLFHGADCLSSAMLAATRYVCEHETVRQEMKVELQDAGVEGGRRLDGPTLRRLPILHSVVMETLRLYPPIPLMHRVVTAPGARLRGYDLEPGQLLSYAIRTPHLDRGTWGVTAHDFCPARHWPMGGGPSTATPHIESPAGGGRQEPTAGGAEITPLWVPFGGGARHCPGADLATVALYVYLARLVQDHTLEIEGGVRMMRMPPHVRPDFDLRVRRSIPVSLHMHGGGGKASACDPLSTHVTRAPSYGLSTPTSIYSDRML